MIKYLQNLLLFFSAELGVSVEDTDVEFSGTLDDGETLGGRNGRDDFSSEDLVGHHESFEVLNVTNGNLVKTTGEHVLSLVVGSVTDGNHTLGAAEATADGTIDTLRRSPRFTNALEAVRVHALEVVSLLLNDLLVSRGHQRIYLMEMYYGVNSENNER